MLEPTDNFFYLLVPISNFEKKAVSFRNLSSARESIKYSHKEQDVSNECFI